jgi:hypothetical protein
LFGVLDLVGATAIAVGTGWYWRSSHGLAAFRGWGPLERILSGMSRWGTPATRASARHAAATRASSFVMSPDAAILGQVLPRAA